MLTQCEFNQKTHVKSAKNQKRYIHINIDVSSIREENENTKSQKQHENKISQNDKIQQLNSPKSLVEKTYKNIEEEDDATTQSCTQEVNTEDKKTYNISTEKTDISANNKHTNQIIEKKEINQNINITNKNIKIINKIVNVINEDNKNKLIPNLKLPLYEIYCRHILIPEIQIYLKVKNEKNNNNTIHTTNYIQYEDIENERTREVTRELNENKRNFKNNIHLNINNNKDIINHKKLIFNIPIDEIKKESSKKNKNINNRNNINNNINEKINVENLRRNLNPNICPGISNSLFSNRLNINTNPFMGNNKLMGMQNNVNNVYNINSNVYNNKIAQINELKMKFQKFKDLGLYAMMNPQNINHYLLNLYINNINSLNQCLPYNNINYNFNNFRNQNPLLQNYMNNQNFMNLNRMNNCNGINTLNNLNNLNNQKYTITIKNKTNDPTIEKVSKIQVTTYCVKDNSKIKPENTDTVKKEKNIKNIINLDNIKSGKETRTVVRLNPIPPNYSSFDVCKLLDKYLQIESGKNQRIYKALYTPLCKIIGKNLGYCFVMMVKPKYVLDFYKTFNGKSFGKKKCKKPCKVIWADIQGEDFLKASEDDPIRKPIIFKDIRDD